MSRIIDLAPNWLDPDDDDDLIEEGWYDDEPMDCRGLIDWEPYDYNAWLDDWE